MAENGAATNSSSPPLFDIAHHLPLRLIRSEIIPPAPNLTNSASGPAIDWLYDFAGYTWIAYGASSLLVISHFPNPLSHSETLIGPIFRQVFQLSVDGTGIVSAVSWSPATPSAGDLAAALDNCIGVFSYNSDIPPSNSSFCWSQSAILVQSTKAEVIQWTVSGDGIIVGGIEIVLWRKREKSWERAWKFKRTVPHTLVSASWSIEGPLATAPFGKLQVGILSSPVNEACNSVAVNFGHGDSKFFQSELRHPLPISMIQWRPLTGRPLNGDVRQPPRLMLLTSCFDGSVRLWSQSDDGKVKKGGKDSCDHAMTKLSFRVVAVIEVNQALNGTLGSTVFVTWATEIDSIARPQFFSPDYQYNKTGYCEWLIGFGPQLTVTLWAIHCLDEFSPLRFPRVTLWKRQELISPQVGSGGLLLNKVFIKRNKMFTPPTMCSLLQVLPCNSLALLHSHSQASPDAQDRSTNNCYDKDLLSSCASGILDIDSHTGTILKVVVHPYLFEAGLAASLDTNGLLLFWSLSTASNGVAGLRTLNPSCKLYRRSVFSETHAKCTSLAWAPAIFNEVRVLFMGHAGGIDCFIVKVMDNEEDKIAVHRLCTIQYGSQDFDRGPTTLSSIPVLSACNRTSVSGSFMVIAVWKNSFQALSWNITIHHCDLLRNCFKCSCNIGDTAENNLWTFESDFSGTRYFISIHPYSSVLPAPYDEDMISSFAVVHPSNFFSFEEQGWSSADEFSPSYSTYHMVTGCSDGTVKLWRSLPANLSSLKSLWDLVGVIAAHQGPVLAISPSVCGRKIATVSHAGCLSSASTVHVWECVHFGTGGKFILEDTICFEGEVVALNWLMLGNGHLLLGVCSQNELKIYAQRRCGGQDSLKSEEHVEGNIWVCIAVTSKYPLIQDFFWGPKATVGVLHHDYFSLFSPFSLLDKKNLLFCCPKSTHPSILNDGCNEYLLPAVFIDSDICGTEGSSVEDCGQQLKPRPSVNMIAEDNLLPFLDVERSKQNLKFDSLINFWSLSEVSQKLGGSLSAFHPEALLLNISKGNWKRAYVTLQYVLENIASAKIHGKMYCLGKGGHVVSQVPLSNYLEGLPFSSSGDKSFQQNGAADSIASSSQFQKGAFAFGSSWAQSANALPSFSVRSEPTDFVDVLGKLYESAGITNTEKMQMHAIIDILQEVINHHTVSVYGSLDEPGRRFWVAVRFQLQYFAKIYGRLPLAGELVVSSEQIGWAFHSDCEENLFDSLLSNEPSWQEMRDVGVGYWYTNTSQLRLKMEKLARQQYLKAKDPKACILLYIALNRIQVLAGLFKMSKDEKDKPLVGFLSRNFQDEKNRAAALKNAYVLMGKHQLELAIAFFLLGGDTYSAVNVCAKNLGDEQLALVICRLVEGYGGPLEHQLISKIILPSAVSRGDYWLASLFEWILGNYTKAYLSMFGDQTSLINKESAVSTSKKSLLDPSIGQYCLMLANKTNMKNAIGEQKAAVLSRWAVLISAIALSRCGLPLEALECLSSCRNAFGAQNQGTVLENGDVELLNQVLELSPVGDSSNWTFCDLAKQKELLAKSDLAMQYLSPLLKEHPSWGDIMVPFGGCNYMESAYEEYKRSVENFYGKLTVTLEYFQQKFSLNPFHLIDKIVLFLHNNGLQYIGYHIFRVCGSRFLSPEQSCRFDAFLSHPHKLLFRMTEEVSTVSRFIVSSSLSCSHLKVSSTKSGIATETCSHLLVALEFYQWNLIRSLQCIRATLKLFFGSSTEDILHMPLTVIDLAEYYVYFASSWSQMNLSHLALISKPILKRFSQEDTPQEILKDLNKILSEIRKILADELPLNDIGAFEINEEMRHEQAGDILVKIPEDDRWLVIVVSFWGQISSFLKHLLDLLIEVLEESSSVQSPRGLPLLTMPTLSVVGPDGKDVQLPTAVLPFSKLLDVTCSHISFYCAKQLASYLLLKGDTRITTILLSTEKDYSESFSQSKYFSQRVDTVDMWENEADLSPHEIFWHICADPKIIPGFVKENLKWFECIKKKSSRGWVDVYASILREYEGGEIDREDDRLGSPCKAAGSPVACLTPNEHPFIASGGKDTEKVVPFKTPAEIYKRSGELLEALCINSIDQCQAALATNRKGIICFNLEDGLPCGDESKYVWADADWPQNGWAGSESTPVPTCVYPGVGLGSRKGARLGLGGATVGAGLFAESGKELKDGGAFGLPGYSGMVGSSLGWGVQADFEQFIDPIPTVGSVNASSFSTHPSRPLFLVGSSNTHVYLWEFGKDRATATYGVLPAANVPPPYALASISAVRFDHCGHRFVTAAQDGTVCTWQLEVGGRSNVGPTESSICFDNHTSDVTYVTPSGSIIAAAGYSSTGINVVIWDTLAPTATSRASIMCHEGGARSLCVFDHNLGSGSVSPLIVTGGKAGDVGLHDFRYIATGRTKKHKHTDNIEQNANLSSTEDMHNKTGDQNRNGMLWYIPKAHAASVTKISTIPNTSYFLTGSKDGDVKLWDAKRARLVFHWPRLHERHTFLQPSSRGFGGVFRAAVTDIQVVSHGFLTCGGDGTVKLIKLKDFSHF
ncbi:unnamed protein product [Coffea canephora]|uniref:RAVE complex protein Rav1 C-terminal domain-containing protein n=1 Tax=Coffea canephora TaxID=49390 RepID=A0A068UJM4_COFCA|nr:unnamed protein product [Coffea canephora]